MKAYILLLAAAFHTKTREPNIIFFLTINVNIFRRGSLSSLKHVGIHEFIMSVEEGENWKNKNIFCHCLFKFMFKLKLLSQHFPKYHLPNIYQGQ